MYQPRKKPAHLFHALLVEPQPGFKPTNWRQTPEHYRIIQHVGTKLFRGRIDAWKFLHNHNAMTNKPIDDSRPKVWAIYHDVVSENMPNGLQA